VFSQLGDKLQEIFKDLRGHGKISEANVDAALRQVRLALLEADVDFEVAKKFIARIRDKALGEAVLRSITPGQQIVKIFYDELSILLGGDAAPLNLGEPHRILIVGLNGSGKTTSAAKLARLLKKQGRSPNLVALDLQRPAAIEQLATLGKQIDVPVFTPEASEKNVQRVAESALQDRQSGSIDIFDTAGRQEIDVALIEELAQLKRFLNPQETLLVVDAATGQQAVSVATRFDEALEITGIILTKLDGDARGGAALSMRAITGKPIVLIGTGEKIDALEPFHPERIAGRILGMGDVVTLVERAAETADQDEAERLARKFEKGNFDLDDLAAQLRQLRRMGGMSSMLGMLPGIGKIKKQIDAANIDEAIIKRQEAIIGSMTRSERKNPKLLNASRRRRIATGSGTSVPDINRLLKQYQDMAGMMKKMKKLGQKGLMRHGLSALMPGGGRH